MKICAIILTYNEERHIGRAIASIGSFVDQICVVDSGSTDRTISISERLGAEIYYHPFVNQAKQIQWALDNIILRGDWVLRLDADEVIESDLVEEIRRKLPRVADDVVGVNLRRKHIFMGRWVRHGGRYPVVMLRLWRKGHGYVEDRWMDEHMFVQGGRTITLRGGFSDWNLNDLSYFVDKHNRYATREAVEVLLQRRGNSVKGLGISLRGASFQVSFKRFIKESIFNKLPFTASSLLYFIWRYIFLLGFLDGRSGLIYHFLQGYWYRFMVGAKIFELSRSIEHLSCDGDIRLELSRLTGLDLNEQDVDKPRSVDLS